MLTDPDLRYQETGDAYKISCIYGNNLHVIFHNPKEFSRLYVKNITTNKKVGVLD